MLINIALNIDQHDHNRKEAYICGLRVDSDFGNLQRIALMGMML
jgi:hypothetical protein